MRRREIVEKIYHLILASSVASLAWIMRSLSCSAFSIDFNVSRLRARSCCFSTKARSFDSKRASLDPDSAPVHEQVGFVM
jgi:hypothetical protein